MVIGKMNIDQEIEKAKKRLHDRIDGVLTVEETIGDLTLTVRMQKPHPVISNYLKSNIYQTTSMTGNELLSIDLLTDLKIHNAA